MFELAPLGVCDGQLVRTEWYVLSWHVCISFQGEFQSLSKPVESPVTAPPLPVPGSVDRMMYVWFTDYVANTAGYVYQTAGVLTYKVTPDMVRCSYISTAGYEYQTAGVLSYKWHLVW